MLTNHVKSDPLASVIVSTYNSERTLYMCLESVTGQTYRGINLIVIDAESKDSTESTSTAHGRRSIRVFHCGLTHQSNIELKASEVKCVYMSDSDSFSDVTQVEEAVQLFESRRLGGISTFSSSDPMMGLWALVRNLEKSCYRGDLSRFGARFVRRDPIEVVEGWNEDVAAGEDYDLCNRLAAHDCSMGFIEAGGLHIDEPRNLGVIAGKQFAYGKTIRGLSIENRSKGLIQNGSARSLFIVNAGRYLEQPAPAFGFVVYETVVHFSALVGFLASILADESGGR